MSKKIVERVLCSRYRHFHAVEKSKRLKSPLHCSCRNARIDLLLADEEHHKRRQYGDEHTCANEVVLILVRSRKHVQGDGDRLNFWRNQIQVCTVVFVVRSNTLQNHTRNNCRLKERQND